MKKQLFAIALIQSFVLQPVLADSLNQYRAGIMRDLKTTEQMSLERMNNLRAQLQTASAPAIQIQDSNSNNNHMKIYSSIILKNVLQMGLDDIMRARKYGGSIPFDPSWSTEEHRAILGLEERKTCVDSIMKSRKNISGKNDGMDVIVKEIYSKLAKKGESRTLEIDPGNGPIEAVRAHLGRGPLSGNRSVLDILGQVEYVEMVEGMAHRVTFGSGDEHVQASLSMLLTNRMGEDAIFTSTQDCLLNYLKDQNDVFANRLGQKNSSGIWQAFNSAYSNMSNWWNQVERSKPGIMASSPDKVRAAGEIREMYDMIQTTDDTARFLAQLKFFSEGHDFSKDSAAETKFMQERMSLAKSVIPYLESRAKSAHLANDKMNQLSKEQVNYLLDMFLQLRGRDLPTAQDLSGMGEAFAERAKILSGAGDKGKLEALMADSMYYQVIGTQLTDLEAFLVSERENAAAKQKDLDKIRRP